MPSPATESPSTSSTPPHDSGFHPCTNGTSPIRASFQHFCFFLNFHSKVGPALLRSTLDGLIEQVATFGARTLVLLLRDHPKWMDRRMLMGQNELWHLSALISLLFRRSPFHEISRCLKFTDRRVEFD